MEHRNDSNHHKLTLDVLPAVAFLLFGLVMIYGSITMEPSFSGTNEHRWVPLGMSIFVSLLAGWICLRRQFSPEVDPDGARIERRNFFLLVLPCILLLAAYAQAYIWFGYVAATFVCGVLVFRLFQNGWLSSTLQSAVATMVLYVLFFVLLKLYNPPGRLLDLSLPF